MSGTCGALDGALATSFVAPRSLFSLFSTISTFSTASTVRAAGDCRPYRWRGLTVTPSLYIFYISYTVNITPPYPLPPSFSTHLTPCADIKSAADQKIFLERKIFYNLQKIRRIYLYLHINAEKRVVLSVEKEGNGRKKCPIFEK